MHQKTSFIVSYWAVHLAPVAVTLGVIAHWNGLPAWQGLLPVILLVPAFLILLRQRCPRCGALIYTTENLGRVEGGFRKLPLHRFAHCPACGEAL